MFFLEQATTVVIRDKKNPVRRRASPLWRVLKVLFIGIIFGAVLLQFNFYKEFSTVSVSDSQLCMKRPRIMCLAVCGDSEEELDTARLYESVLTHPDGCDALRIFHSHRK